MRETKCCTKCEFKSLIFISSKVLIHGTGNNIMVNVTLSIVARLHRYVCENCGYTEEWIEADDIKELKKHFS